MSRLKVKNFGPIRDGFLTDGWMDIKKVTVLIGDQGSGKSTVAKLISVFSWLEKNIVKGNISIDQLNVATFRNLCAQQEIYEYFSDNTYLTYEGEVCSFELNWKENTFKSNRKNEIPDQYVLPKIQYVSAARNLLTILYNISNQNIVDNKGNVIDLSSNIPFMVRELNREYMKALSELAQNGFSLPISDTIVYFQNQSTYITTRGEKVSMSSASSGIQSITPMLLVSYYLSNEVRKDTFKKIQVVDDAQKNRIEKELRKENNTLAEDFKLYSSFGKDMLENAENVAALETMLKKYLPSSFINVVEEPEQNLFPTSQQNVFNQLLELNNLERENKLVVTTHSPYIIGYLTLAIKAYELYKRAGNDNIRQQINEIVPQMSSVSHEDVVIYELEEKSGSIQKLGDYNGIPSSKNYLNKELAEKNELYAKLLDLEDLCR